MLFFCHSNVICGNPQMAKNSDFGAAIDFILAFLPFYKTLSTLFGVFDFTLGL